MYVVRFKQSKVIACRFSVRDMAKIWYDLNNFDQDSGEDLGLFEVVKLSNESTQPEKHTLEGSKKAQD